MRSGRYSTELSGTRIEEGVEMNKAMAYLIGYEFKSMMGESIKKVIVCDTEEEYERVRKKILDARENGVEPIFFDEIIDSKVIK